MKKEKRSRSAFILTVGVDANKEAEVKYEFPNYRKITSPLTYKLNLDLDGNNLLLNEVNLVHKLFVEGMLRIGREYDAAMENSEHNLESEIEHGNKLQLIGLLQDMVGSMISLDMHRYPVPDSMTREGKAITELVANKHGLEVKPLPEDELANYHKSRN